MNKQYIFFISRVSLGILFLLFLCLGENFSSRNSFYHSQNNNKDLKKSKTPRIPANFLDYQNRDRQVFQDYFSYDSFQKSLYYEITPYLHTNLKNPSLSQKADKALKKSLGENLEKYIQFPEYKTSWAMVLQENLMISFIKSFIHHLKALKINDGVFQIDLNFIPQIIKKKSYTKELGLAKMIHWLPQDDLLRELNHKPVPLNQKIFNAQIPDIQDFYQYRGGQITFWFKISQGEENRGFIRYRRYFKTSQLDELKPFIKFKNFEITKTELKKGKNIPRHFITVDIVKDLDLETFNFSPKRMEIYFSRLLPENFYSESILLKRFFYRNQIIQTGNFFIFGKLHDQGRKVAFKTKLETLLYDFETQSFSPKSKISTSLINDSAYNREKAGGLQLKIRYKLINEFGVQLVEALKMGRLHKKVAMGEK